MSLSRLLVSRRSEALYPLWVTQSPGPRPQCQDSISGRISVCPSLHTAVTHPGCGHSADQEDPGGRRQSLCQDGKSLLTSLHYYYRLQWSARLDGVIIDYENTVNIMETFLREASPTSNVKKRCCWTFWNLTWIFYPCVILCLWVIVTINPFRAIGWFIYHHFFVKFFNLEEKIYS